MTEQWIFPLREATGTPDIGRFGAARTSRRIHAGIDLYAPVGTEVVAMTSGRVREIMDFYEDLLDIEVENDDGTMIRYCELTPQVSVGDRVVKGQVIGRLRANSEGGCMLHLEVFATDAPEALTQTANRTDYLHVPAGEASYMRRRDLVDPGAVYSLEGWIP